MVEGIDGGSCLIFTGGLHVRFEVVVGGGVPIVLFDPVQHCIRKVEVSYKGAVGCIFEKREGAERLIPTLLIGQMRWYQVSVQPRPRGPLSAQMGA